LIYMYSDMSRASTGMLGTDPANAHAMRLAGIDDNTKNPSGGEILRDQDGHATGVLRETAEDLVGRVRARAAANPATWQRAIEQANEECLANGITSFHDAGTKFAEIDMYRAAAQAGKLEVRLWIMVRDSLPQMQQRLDEYRMVNFADGYLTVRAIKQSLDGALGSHGAWVREPYEDLVSSTGLNTLPLSELKQVAKLAAEKDFQLCVHAIGDQANHEVLNLYEQTFKRYPTKNSRRWRIEHAQHLLPTDIPRFGKLKVIAAMQGIHCTSDAVFVGMRLGQRRAATGAYMWRSLLDNGATIANGTDAPVEDVNPIPSFYASVTRKTRDGVAFFPAQCMTREEALRSYTIDAAYAAFEDTTKGSLSPGKVADITVLSRNLMTCPEDEILKTEVEFTVVGGEIRFRQ
ncbi:MAG: amidohydrolase, partial [Planctomycetota bacterium]